MAKIEERIPEVPEHFSILLARPKRNARIIRQITLLQDANRQLKKSQKLTGMSIDKILLLALTDFNRRYEGIGNV